MNLAKPDDLQWIALTVAMEAEGEPWEGKLGVAWVIVNRMKANKASPSDTVLAPMQFSAWNSDSPTRKRLDELPENVWVDSYRAAAAAYFGLVPDPTSGSTFYLNIEATKRGRGDNTLPKWAADPDDQTRVNASKVRVVIGRHTFMKG